MNSVGQIGGIYLLMSRLPGPRWIQIGGLEPRLFRRGSYAYVGSARRGISSRLNRHLSDEKRPHWHIDYLLRYAELEVIVYGECTSDKECALATVLSRVVQSIPGFGSTDCRCTSHLFFSPHRNRLVGIGYGSLGRIGLTPRLYWKKASMRISGLDVEHGWRMENHPIPGYDARPRGLKDKEN